MNEYISPENIAAGVPDLRPHFKHARFRMMPHSPHAVASDFADIPSDDPVLGIYRNSCGFQTRDEAGIQFRYAKQVVRDGSAFLDIGAHTGWVSMHFAYADGNPTPEVPDMSRVGDPRADVVVHCVDPMFRADDKRFASRFVENTAAANHRMTMFAMTSEEFRECDAAAAFLYAGVSIDGDHSPGYPLADAALAVERLADDGFIALHDAWGEPVAEACRWLMDQRGFKGQWYDTPHGLFVARRGDVKLEPHTPDPTQNWRGKRSMTLFPFERCS